MDNKTTVKMYNKIHSGNPVYRIAEHFACSTLARTHTHTVQRCSAVRFVICLLVA